MKIFYSILFLLQTLSAAPDVTAVEATSYTKQKNQSVADSLALDEQRDWDNARRGFIGTRKDPFIRNEAGQVVWSLSRFEFMESEPPPTANPSLWRQGQLNNINGLFKVVDRVYQVRGFDIAVMTIIEGDSGHILVDPLLNRETAAAALELAREHLGNKPVKAVLFTHSHADHFGGVRGVVDEADVRAGKVQIIAPEGFTEAAVSENVIAGNAMTRRVTYMFGSLLPKNPQGDIGTGLGNSVPTGSIGMIQPTHEITHTGGNPEHRRSRTGLSADAGCRGTRRVHVLPAPVQGFLPGRGNQSHPAQYVTRCAVRGFGMAFCGANTSTRPCSCSDRKPWCPLAVITGPPGATNTWST